MKGAAHVALVDCHSENELKTKPKLNFHYYSIECHSLLIMLHSVVPPC